MAERTRPRDRARRRGPSRRPDRPPERRRHAAGAGGPRPDPAAVLRARIAGRCVGPGLPRSDVARGSGVRRPTGGLGRGTADPARLVVRAGAGALLPRAAPDRARLAAHLFDIDGRVATSTWSTTSRSSGHGHPRLSEAVDAAVAAAQHQLALPLRARSSSSPSGSRRLLPDPLDTVFLVNSGSEAVDLALRLALGAHRPARRASRCAEAYHGWTVRERCRLDLDRRQPERPRARGPPGCTPSTRPNAYRGPHRGAEAAPLRRRRRRARSPSSRPGRPPAGFIAEPYYGNAGGMALPGRLPRRRSTPRCARAAACASPTRCRSATAGSATTSGASSSRASCPTSSPSPRRWATVTRSAPSSPPARSPTRYRSQGYFFSSAGGSPVSAAWSG